MSAAQSRTPGKNAVISELALARAQRNTVLIIDDLFSSRLLLAEIVRQIDGKLNLELFDTPSRALEYARNNRVDMVLTDYKLPEFDGVQLVRQIRALPHCIDVPIVVITVVDDRRVRYEALEAGATDFLIKPLDEHETRARCSNLLDLRRHKIVLSDQARVLQYQVDKSVAEIHERELETLSKLAKAGALDVMRDFPGQPDSELSTQRCLERLVIAGTPESVADQIRAFRNEVGPFGTLLYTGHDWTDPALARRSMELMANEVWPRIDLAEAG